VSEGAKHKLKIKSEVRITFESEILDVAKKATVPSIVIFKSAREILFPVTFVALVPIQF
jgi:hypothetical protein